MPDIHDIVKTPLPFPTLPIAVAPRSQRSWIENKWWVVFVVEVLVIFAVFCALLVYYLHFVRTPGKWVGDDKVDSAGLSHYGSMVGGSEFGGDQGSASGHSPKRSFDSEGEENTANRTVNSKQARKRGRRGEAASKRSFVLKWR